MATFSKYILNAAFKLGFIPKRLSEDEKLILFSGIVTANQIYWLISEAGQPGIDLEQLVARSKLNSNTIKIYARWMAKNKLILISRIGIKNIYFVM